MAEGLTTQVEREPVENLDQFVEQFVDDAKVEVAQGTSAFDVASDLMSDQINDAASNLTAEEQAALLADAQTRFPDYKYTTDDGELSFDDIEQRARVLQGQGLGDEGEAPLSPAEFRGWVIADLSQNVLADKLG